MATSNNVSSTVSISAATSVVTVSSTVSTSTTTIKTMNVITLSAVSSTVVSVLARAFRPAVATRAQLKAAARLAMARASRKANRVSKARRTRTQSFIGPVVSRAYRLARIAAKAARRADRAAGTQLVITVGMVHGCALPKPSMKVAPLGSNELPDGFRLVHRAARTGAPANAVKSVDRIAPATARPGSAVSKAPAFTAPRLKERAAVVVVAKVTPEVAPSSFVVEGVEAQITSLRAGLENLVIAGPTADDYGWSYISIEELAASIYDEEVTSTTAHTVKPDHDLYNIVVCALGANPQASNQPNDNAMLVPPQNIKVVYVNKVPMFPAKAFTKINYPTPANFYAMETGRVPYKSVNDKGTFTFIGEEGTFNLMQNMKNGSIFMKNSHIRAFSIDGEKRSFIDFLQKSLDKSVEEANSEFFAMMEVLQEEGGMEAEEAYSEAVGQLGQPKKYLVLESIGTKNAQGVYEYTYDMDAINEVESQYTALGYQVLGVQSSLLLSNIGIANFRLDGNAPCVPVTASDLRGLSAMGITEWNASNIHQAVKPVTDLAEWLKDVMVNVKAISFSFNGVTSLVESTSPIYGTVHQYSLTTDPERYSEFNIEEGSVPAWTINLWSSTPTAKSLTPQKDTLDIAKAARVFESKTPAQGPSKSLSSLMMQKQQMKQAKVAQVTAAVRPPAVPASLIVRGNEKGVDMETVPAALDQDSAGGAHADELEELSPVPLSPVVTTEQRGAVEEVATTTAQRLTNTLSSLTFTADDDELCQAITLKDIDMLNIDGLYALSNLCSELGITIEVLADGSDNLGKYSNGVIYIAEGLSDNHRAQVLLHELVHAVFASMDGEVVAAICESWLSTVGQSAVTPAGVNVEEQFAYSFMEHAHNVETLVGLLHAMATGEAGWEVMYNELEEAAEASKAVVVNAAPIAVVGEGEAVVTTPKKNAVLEALLEVTSQDLLVLTDAKGTLPAVYTEAFPELVVVPGIELGAVVSMITVSGLKVYAICGVTAEATLSIEGLKLGLETIASLGSDKTYICEADLGFGGGITSTPAILGAVRQALGQAKVKTISMPAMARLAKEWKNAGAAVEYPQADLSLWPSGLMKGTALVAVPVGTTADVFNGNPDTITGTTVSATMSILNADGSIDEEALALGLAELEGYITNGDIPLPIYCYSCQLAAFSGISCGITVVEYAKGVFLSTVKVGVLSESPIKEETLANWYYYLLDGVKGADEGMFNVADLSSQLYTKAFKAMGLPVELASYALSPLPLSWLQHGIVLVVPGKNAKGLVDRHVSYEELIDEALLNVLVDRNIKVYTAEWAFDKTAKKSVIKGTESKVYRVESGYGVYALPDGMEGESMVAVKEDESDFVNGNVIGMNISNKAIHTLDNYMQKHVLDTLQYLIDTNGVEMAIQYMEAILPKLVKKVKVGSTGKVQYALAVYNQQNAAEYYMEFTPEVGNPSRLSARHCTVSSGRADRCVNAITNLSGFPDTIYDGVTVALGLAISAASGRKLTQDAFEGYLAGTTNLWARSENYGLELTTVQTPNYTLTDTLKVIIDNSGKTISSTRNQNVDAKGVALGREVTARWPYHMPCNASLDLSVMASLMKKGELVLCDKYAMERIVVGDGARAMLASILSPEDAAKLNGYNEAFGLEIALNPLNGDAVYTVCWPTDKASKALNRPSQFHGSSQADGWKEILTWCPLHTDLGNGNRSAVRGFEQIFISTPTDFLSQGSGAASQHPDASVWSFKVNGSMRSTLDWHQVPAVQEAKDANGNNLPGLRCHASIMGPDAFSGPSGKDLDGKEVPASKWFCDSFAQKWIGPAIEAAMYTDSSKKEYRVYGPEEEMVVLFDKMYTKQGEKVGYYPNGNTPGLPSARLVLFSNNLGKQNCIITGYRLMPMQRGERLQVVLEYATVMDTREDSSEWSGAKARGLGIKFIISHDATIDYLGGTAPLNGVEKDLNELYKAGAIHVTSEGLKGNYAFMQGFAAAHGNAYESGPYLCIDQYLMDGTENPHYVDGDARMVSDMTDTESYFYQWVRSNTRVVRMRKSVNEDVWNYIMACNRKSMDENGNLPGVEVIDRTPHAIQWDVEGREEVTDAKTVTVEYDVQVLVFHYWVQVEVAPPGACTGNQGMTAEQASNLEVMLKDTSTRLWARGQNSRTGVENAVKSAETHALVEAGKHVDGIFYFNPLNKSHNELMEQLLYQVSATGTRTLRPAKDFYLLLATIFGGAAADTSVLWAAMVAGEVANIDYVNGEVVTYSEGYNYLQSVDGLAEVVSEGIGLGFTGQGLAICSASEETGDNTVTYVDPTVFLQLGAFESILVAADPKTHKPARKVSGAATGIVNDIHKAFLDWTTTEFWNRKGASSAVHGINSRLRNSMLGWIGVNSKQATMMNAKGVLGRIARIDQSAGVAGKVCTGIGPQYAHHTFTDENGVEHKLPVAIMHPDCLLAKGLNHGDIVGVGRTPTVSLAFCVVKFSRTYGRIGYIHMGFNVWAAGNNGDTDGDPCNRIRVGGVVASGKWKGATYMQAVKLNKHPLGMGGYEVVCGRDPVGHDCADFVSFKGVWTKKALNNKLIPASIAEWAVESNLKIKDLEPLVNLMLPATLLDSAKKVSQHYRANVGVAYGWCSAYSAHMKEKHSFLEAVVTHLLNSEVGKSYGAQAPSVDEMMEVLVSGEIYTAMNSKVEVPATEPAPTEATPTQPEFYMEPDADAIAAIYAKYPVIMGLCEAKAAATTNPMNLVTMGQHIKVMLEASAWLWRGIYEGLGLSGYSPDASAFFEAFNIALRNKGMVRDASTKDDKGKVTMIVAMRPVEGKSVSIAEFLSAHYGMPVDAANEIFAACLLYNGYRAIERGQHLPGEDEEQATTLETYTELYASTMSEWPDTKPTEYIEHAVLAGVFRRAGQGTTGVSLDDEMSTQTSAQMIYTYAQALWSEKLGKGVAVFRNLMLNDIVAKSVTLYNKLVSIASIDAEGEYYID